MRHLCANVCPGGFLAVSLREVAEKAGVSIGTVLRILNGDRSARLPPETRERVRRIACDLGYRPNRLGRSLREGRTGTIGLMISGLRNPFFVSVLEAAEVAAASHGYQVMLDVGPSMGGTYNTHPRLRE